MYRFLRLFFELCFINFLLFIGKSTVTGDLIDFDVECSPNDIQLYTWTGPGFQAGECWYQGHRFSDGTTWGRTDLVGGAYCVCEQGKVRIFYSQQSSPESAGALTLFEGAATAKDLKKWPIINVIHQRQRIVFCSLNRLGLRIRSRDGCLTCKCSRNGHWLCRRTFVDNQ